MNISDPIGDNDEILLSMIIDDVYFAFYDHAGGLSEKWVHRFYSRLELRYSIVCIQQYNISVSQPPTT